MSAEALAKEEWRQGLIVERGRPCEEEEKIQPPAEEVEVGGGQRLSPTGP